ncbi:uncharacterized protein C1orf131 homolog [Ylistrum balloti]|uniref:uncharacterized protein C1orf131 homolog n=1 Tax=Ylistrum balloti TaxID=509963 RepID=UPI002905D72C|nr:uncharacterized protein C1orf131 homolog [Ylistrum balloti]XP_060069762.1 uncharacterized protein C1orf131 homolog [Ylistrum balloti]
MDTEDKLQKQILKRLEQINEQFLDNDDYERRVKKARFGKRKSESSQCDTDDTGTHKTQSRRQKKKQRKCEQKKSLDSMTVEISQPHTVKGEKRHLQDLKKSLGLTGSDVKSKVCDQEIEQISKKPKHQGPEVVVFHKPGKKKQMEERAQESSSEKSNNVAEDQPEFDMKKARFEVQKVGIKGFSGNEKDEAMTSFLVKLGAKLPKNKCYKYKEFLEMRKQEKESVKQKKIVDRGLGYKVTSSKNTKKKSKDRNDVGVLDGQVGHYKDGIQFIKKKDLKGFNRKNKR